MPTGYDAKRDYYAAIGLDFFQVIPLETGPSPRDIARSKAVVKINKAIEKAKAEVARQKEGLKNPSIYSRVSGAFEGRKKEIAFREKAIAFFEEASYKTRREYNAAHAKYLVDSVGSVPDHYRALGLKGQEFLDADLEASRAKSVIDRHCKGLEEMHKQNLMLEDPGIKKQEIKHYKEVVSPAMKVLKDGAKRKAYNEKYKQYQAILFKVRYVYVPGSEPKKNSEHSQREALAARMSVLGERGRGHNVLKDVASHVKSESGVDKELEYFINIKKQLEGYRAHLLKSAQGAGGEAVRNDPLLLLKLDAVDGLLHEFNVNSTYQEFIDDYGVPGSEQAGKFPPERRQAMWQPVCKSLTEALVEHLGRHIVPKTGPAPKHLSAKEFRGKDVASILYMSRSTHNWHDTGRAVLKGILTALSYMTVLPAFLVKIGSGKSVQSHLFGVEGRKLSSTIQGLRNLRVKHLMEDKDAAESPPVPSSRPQ